MEKTIAKLALQILNNYRKKFADYDEEVAEHYRSADQKYSFPACIHGTSRWTDYDNICGPCEDGLGYWDYSTFARMAIDQATSDLEEFHKRQDLYRDLSKAKAPIADDMIGWVIEPIKRHSK